MSQPWPSFCRLSPDLHQTCGVHHAAQNYTQSTHSLHASGLELQHSCKTINSQLQLCMCLLVTADHTSTHTIQWRQHEHDCIQAYTYTAPSRHFSKRTLPQAYCGCYPKVQWSALDNRPLVPAKNSGTNSNRTFPSGSMALSPEFSAGIPVLLEIILSSPVDMSNLF